VLEVGVVEDGSVTNEVLDAKAEVDELTVLGTELNPVASETYRVGILAEKTSAEREDIAIMREERNVLLQICISD